MGGRQDAPTPLDWLDKTVACALKRAMLVGMGRLNPTVMAHVNGPLNRSLAIERYISRRLCHIGTSVTREGLADMVLAVLQRRDCRQYHAFGAAADHSRADVP
jgi:hypothetical protein